MTTVEIAVPGYRAGLGRSAVRAGLIDTDNLPVQTRPDPEPPHRPDGPKLVVRQCRPEGAVAYWRWTCRWCGEYGGGRHHGDALSRALRHCVEHPEHRSAVVPPAGCRPTPPPLHPALVASPAIGLGLPDEDDEPLPEEPLGYEPLTHVPALTQLPLPGIAAGVAGPRPPQLTNPVHA